MKNLVKFILILSPLLLLGSARGFVSDDPMFPELNPQITSLVNSIKSDQARFLNSENRYFQVIKVAEIPNRGSLINAEYKRPHYESKDIEFSFPKILPFTYSVTVYENSLGEKGYEIIFWLKENGKIYRKSIGFGVEGIKRTSNWTEQ